MKASSIIAAASAFAGCVSAAPAPLEKRQNIDTTVLQFALTLEHLENVFYKQALATLSQSMFLAANYSATYYSNLKYIAHDEESHVEVLSAALMAAGVTPNAACTYNFPITDVASFITLSSVLEGVGVSAYLGGAGLITSKAYLTEAASILVTEAIHTSMQRQAIGKVPEANPYGTPLSPSPVYTLAAAFIKSCPSSNMALPFTAFPALTAVQGMPTAPGITFQFSSAMKAPAAGNFLTFVSGLAVTSVPITNISGNTFWALVPATAMGQTYALLTNSNITALSDSAIIAGPAIIEVTPPSPTFDTSIM